MLQTKTVVHTCIAQEDDTGDDTTKEPVKMELYDSENPDQRDGTVQMGIRGSTSQFLQTNNTIYESVVLADTKPETKPYIPPDSASQEEAQVIPVTCQACRKEVVTSLTQHLLKSPGCQNTYTIKEENKLRVPTNQNQTDSHIQKETPKKPISCKACNIKGIESLAFHLAENAVCLNFYDQGIAINKYVFQSFNASSSNGLQSPCQSVNPTEKINLKGGNPGIICKGCGERNIRRLSSHLSWKPVCRSAYSTEELSGPNPGVICKGCGKRNVKRLSSHLALKPVCRSVYSTEELSGPNPVVICKGCGKRNIKRLSSHLALKPACRSAYSTEELSGPNPVVICKGCGKRNIKRLLSHIALKPVCRSAYSTEELIGPNPEVICKGCGKRHIKRLSSHLALKPVCRSAYSTEELTGPNPVVNCKSCGKRNIKGLLLHLNLKPECQNAYDMTLLREKRRKPRRFWQHEAERDEIQKEPTDHQEVTCKGCNESGIKRLQSHLDQKPACCSAYQTSTGITCKNCNKTDIKILLTHLSAKPECQTAYDMHLLREESRKTRSTKLLKYRETARMKNGNTIPPNCKIPCELCGKEFSRLKSLQSHMKWHMKAFECEKCVKSFGSLGRLNHHTRTMHMRKSFVCTKCGKQFRQNYELNLHLIIHTGEKPHKCTICGNRFTVRSSLLTHLKRHNGEKSYACSKCGKSFFAPYNLKIHMWRHDSYRPYHCRYCGNAYMYARDLRRHIRAFHADVLDQEESEKHSRSQSATH